MNETKQKEGCIWLGKKWRASREQPGGWSLEEKRNERGKFLAVVQWQMNDNFIAQHVSEIKLFNLEVQELNKSIPTSLRVSIKATEYKKLFSSICSSPPPRTIVLFSTFTYNWGSFPKISVTTRQDIVKPISIQWTNGHGPSLPLIAFPTIRKTNE